MASDRSHFTGSGIPHRKAAVLQWLDWIHAEKVALGVFVEPSKVFRIYCRLDTFAIVSQVNAQSLPVVRRTELGSLRRHR